MLADGQYMVWFIADVGGRIPESSVPLVCLLSTKRYVLYRLLVPFIFFIPEELIYIFKVFLITSFNSLLTCFISINRFF